MHEKNFPSYGTIFLKRLQAIYLLTIARVSCWEFNDSVEVYFRLLLCIMQENLTKKYQILPGNFQKIIEVS
jgi:hypothetical protein